MIPELPKLPPNIQPPTEEPPPITVRPPASQTKLLPRLTVVEQVSYQGEESGVVGSHAAYSRRLKTDEQPWVREFTLGDQWKPLECGWIEACGLMTLKNKGLTATVELCFLPPDDLGPRTNWSPPKREPSADCYLPPGESMRVVPADVKRLRVRCREGSARCALTLYPE